MTPNHHPDDDTLMLMAAGRLGASASIVIATHAETCERCRSRLRGYEQLGGALLDDLDMTPMAGGFERVLERIDAEDRDRAVRAVFATSAAPGALAAEIRLPAALAGRAIGKWRWMGPGMKVARIDVPEDHGVSLVLLSIAPGRTMPVHGHSGSEFTQVLCGAFADEHGRFGPGDFAAEDEDSEHMPVVEAGETCICLASIEGRMRPRGLIGRLVQPFIGL